MKWQVDEMASWWNGKLMKWQVDEMASWQNGKLIKWRVDKKASWQNDVLPKWGWHFINSLFLFLPAIFISG
jgi:hypothetical protein